MSTVDYQTERKVKNKKEYDMKLRDEVLEGYKECGEGWMTAGGHDHVLYYIYINFYFFSKDEIAICLWKMRLIEN